MEGIFIYPARAGGYDVVKHAGGEFPMDWYQHRSKAVAYAKRLGADLVLPVFERIA